MRHNKVKKLVILTVFLCICSSPAVTYAKDTRINGEISEQISINVHDNWLTQEVAKQLNKKVDDLTNQDFLSIKKLDLKSVKIETEIPDEMKLLKNLEYLNLNYCRLTGQVPEYLGDLPKLTYLDLGDNKLTKLPDNIEQKIINGKYTYSDVEGNRFSLDEGWHFLKGKWCYLDRKGQRIKGTQTIDGKEYQFTDDGNVREGWETDKDNNKYYFDKMNGLVKNDWKSIDGKWYYFDDKGIMQKGFQTIKNVKYYLDDNGIMVTGWQKVDSKWYYFGNIGAMQYGWVIYNNKKYYLDPKTGVMAIGQTTISGKKYTFSGDGSLMTNVWLDTYNYIQPNGQSVNTLYNYSHSNTNYQLFKYMTSPANQASVDSTAIALHGGDLKNNCVYFSSEALRRIGVNIPRGTCNTVQFENILKGMGFVYSYDLQQLKPGDLVFTNGYSHVFIFMGWDENGYAYIVDNQGITYGGTLHKRLIFIDGANTDRATHFFYYPN
ncbi:MULTISPECIES: leucine-rich repeat domain-containing protein [Clostridium]|uniref:leucine-rich repeat domain-containing protein n=1 Tax=Clostridium TaxID=1485 RepID=UPI000983B2DB|nr:MULTISPECIES: leucine-rich repeat domain-containing protein [Clostridium]AQR95818.1 toxin A [Clostridium saccharoperbutylacetonicum]NSB31681.1 glucan-binding YG repeat protein [Clostridium saccharoperbutylacetonicum]